MEGITLIILEKMIEHYPRFTKIFKRKIIKSFSEDVSCKEMEKGHYIESKIGSPFYFSVILSNKSPIHFSVESLHYKIEYKDIPLQVVYWKNGEEFASNGLKPSIQDLMAKGNANLCLPFNPAICLPSLPEENKGWGVYGSIELECRYGIISVPVSISNTKIPDNYAEERRKYWESISQLFKPPPPPIVS
ncbi:MAG: hypothetical protein KAU16_03960 [Methanophagales archaeon]|nr:hypothetical protein [Methanophagales archaeon]